MHKYEFKLAVGDNASDHEKTITFFQWGEDVNNAFVMAVIYSRDYVRLYGGHIVELTYMR